MTQRPSESEHSLLLGVALIAVIVLTSTSAAQVSEWQEGGT